MLGVQSCVPSGALSTGCPTIFTITGLSACQLGWLGPVVSPLYAAKPPCIPLVGWKVEHEQQLIRIKSQTVPFDVKHNPSVNN